MASTLLNICIDSSDNYALVTWWSEVFGLPLDPDNQPGEEETWIELPNGTTIIFNRVPEPKAVKNRVHICLQPDIPRDEEVERLLGRGATLVGDLREPDGTGWAVLADPEGNEFCVLRSAAERAATGG
ncbi:VOC family protein [Actinokineospora sp. PR83]|uniref:VOC family protein n=1 Tax=Actinokineospora sp. PR83 TaxID=2884908 RepID=UPI001F2450A1|nr:VOC family protein [Actinokineospora sp. PR83]MCG8916893.1 VOC family protein [Actinokineospora sp. PR83]